MLTYKMYVKIEQNLRNSEKQANTKKCITKYEVHKIDRYIEDDEETTLEELTTYLQCTQNVSYYI